MVQNFCEQCGAAMGFNDTGICPHCGARVGPGSPLTPHQTAPSPQGSGDGSKFLIYLGIGLCLLIGIIVILAVFSYIVLGAGFFTTQKSTEIVHSTDYPTYYPTPVVSSASSTHTPSEILTGHLNTKESKIITTNLRDPVTTRYTLKLVGPDTADFDLFVNRGTSVSASDYAYKSTSSRSNERVDIFNPAVDTYSVLIKSISGSGDYVLYIDYEYA
jgi:hypothetical protein